MLFNHWRDGQEKQNENQALLVFVHGFLGSAEDWSACLAFLENQNSLCIDLPCHGKSSFCEVGGFTQTCTQIEQTILQALALKQKPKDTPIILIGYSLGARLVMYGLAKKQFTHLNIKGSVIEGGNFGLIDPAKKAKRLERDQAWASLFATHALEDVLKLWYQQEVFQAMPHAQKNELIKFRLNNLGTQLATMLSATSLAKQPYLLDELLCLTTPIHYICGANDQKFMQLAQESGLNFSVIDGAGHNTHRDNPKAFSMQINQFIQTI